MKTIHFTKQDISLDIRFSIEENTIWMNQNEMTILFDKSASSVSRKLTKLKQFISKNSSVVAEFATTAADGKSYQMSYFNLDIIEMVGNMIDPVFTKEYVSWCK